MKTNVLIFAAFALLAGALLISTSCKREQAPRILVLYYSQTGTTKAVAEQLQSVLGADIAAIEAVVPYDGDFGATIERGKKELDEGILPEIKPLGVDVSAYDVIFLGYPIWFGTYAPPVSTVLASGDLSGKKVVPFCTFGSGGLDSSVKDLKEKLPDTDVLPGYGVRAARIDAMPAEIDRFLKAGGFIKGESVALPDFSIPCPVTEEEAAIFDAAVGDYPMMHAKAEEVASRAVPGGIEYLFTARDLPREMPKDMPAGAVPEPRTMKVYVLAEEGQAPVFTQVVR